VWDFTFEPCGRHPDDNTHARSNAKHTATRHVEHSSSDDGRGADDGAGEADLTCAVTPEVMAALAAEGWAVVDGALGESVANKLRAELDSLQRMEGVMRSNKTAFGADGRKHFAKPHVYEFDMLAADESGVHAAIGDVAARLGMFKKLFLHASTCFVDKLNELSPAMRLARGQTGTTLKLQ
jgi:hypothetical protein